MRFSENGHFARSCPFSVNSPERRFKTRQIALVSRDTLNKNSGLANVVVAIVAVLLVVIAGLGAQLITQQPQQALTKTVTQIVSLTSTVTSLQIPTANNTIDLRANSTVILGVVALGTGMATNGPFLIGALSNPTIKVKVGTLIHIYFHSEAFVGIPQHSFIITSSKPPYPFPFTQSDLTPAFPGASTDNPIQPQKVQFNLSFTPDKPGTYYYICGFAAHAHDGMYGQFIVEE